MICKNCKKEINISELLCEECQFPHNGNLNQKAEFVESKIARTDTYENSIKAYKSAQKIMFAIAGINIAIPIIILIQNGTLKIINLIFYLFSAVIYLNLSLLMKKKPFVSAIIGLTLLLTAIIIMYLRDPTTIERYIYIKIGLVGILSYGVYKGFLLYKLRKSYNHLIN